MGIKEAKRDDLQTLKQQQDKSDKNFSFMNLGAQIVSAVADTARGFITDIYRDEIGGIDDEM